MLLPTRKIGSQAIKVEIRKRVFGAAKISQGTVENGTRAHKIFSRLVMKSNGHLNQALEMPTQPAAARRVPPSVFERLMGLEEAPSIEEG